MLLALAGEDNEEQHGENDMLESMRALQQEYENEHRDEEERHMESESQSASRTGSLPRTPSISKSEQSDIPGANTEHEEQAIKVEPLQNDRVGE